MKHWKIDYAVKNAAGQEEKSLLVEAVTIDDALSKAHKAVATKELQESKPEDMFVIWNVGIREDDVF